MPVATRQQAIKKGVTPVKGVTDSHIRGKCHSTTFYAPLIGSIKSEISNRRNLQKKVERLGTQLYESQKEYMNICDAQKVLSTVSDDNTYNTLSFITGMVNKTMHEVFGDNNRIELKRKLYAGSKPHIVVSMIDDDGNTYDMVLQTGAGVRQVVSFMYTLCLIEIRKGRRFLMIDEKLNGLHAEAKRVISQIIEIFSKSGFQFIIVEYTLNNIGKLYNVEARGTDSVIISLDGREYNDSMVILEDADLSILDKNYVENVEDEEGSEEVIV